MGIIFEFLGSLANCLFLSFGYKGYFSIVFLKDWGLRARFQNNSN
jgi:hypothetical protein